ncbi:hypothetical protein [Balneatrix alpica]|uniref:Uncharacterized protein n=1 Tax=Balneatrix alpica TaxID=75684 RepID=A0ABV5ZC73_9GAMM|nr:hypothetical protein [Balneatrix alpica]
MFLLGKDRVRILFLIGVFSVFVEAEAFANSCENAFREEGDPRNGAEYFASKDISNISVSGVIG